MYEQVTHLTAPESAGLYLWFEPWADGLGFPPGCEVELRAISPMEGRLEVDVSGERTVIYGWVGSTLEVLVEGKIVRSFDQAVPNVPSDRSVKEFVTMLFGPAPTPNQSEKPPLWTKPTARPWWKVW